MKRIILSLILILLVNLHVFGQDIVSASSISVPASPSTSYVTTAGSSTNISSAQSVTLNPGTTLTNGSTVNITINPSLVNPPPSNPSDDLDRNWVQTIGYDENGVELSSTKGFYNYMGNVTQTQIKNYSSGHILATQVLYDLFGRSVITTLPAPINNSSFAYKTNFITNGGSNYNYLNFDGASYNKINTPDEVDNNTQGTLGWYYSNNNTLEPYIATTKYPYLRTEFYRDGSGGNKRSSQPGDTLRMGKNHETIINTFPVINELSDYFLQRNKFFTSNAIGAEPTDITGHAFQSVTTDANGLQVLNITDVNGKPLMSARADASGWLTVNNSFTLNPAPNDYEVTLATSNVLGNQINSFSVSSLYPVSIRRDGTEIFDNYPSIYTYSSSGEPVGGSVYKIISSYPFTYSYVKTATQGVQDAPSQYTESATSNVQYFKLVNPGTVTISGGSCLIYEMKDETSLGTFINQSVSLPAGYYKVVAVNNAVTINYTNKYSDVTYNFYNHLGQNIASISPNGTKALHDNPSSYTTIAQLPYTNLYEYDLQGRIIGSSTTDAGHNIVIYRNDGKPRFSQNAEQKKANNGGRFNYTNYDMYGRLIESGEYVPQNASDAQFSLLSTNSTILEDTTYSGGLIGGVKQDWHRLHYDYASNTGVSSYIQNPIFLKGELSWTENSDSKTWYNYDDLQRITFVVKQINGLVGNKTIDYTFDDKNNVTKIDYQKTVPSERFIHYDDYDADGRLINVQTSLDDITKTQQAKYYYYINGPIKRIELADQLQGLDYTYTPQGWLKAINNPANDSAKDPGKDGNGTSQFAPDAFNMQIEYFPGDYNRAGSFINSIGSNTSYYNGNIAGISWQSKKTAAAKSIIPGIEDPAMYQYTYNPKYQITQANWGVPNFTAGTFTTSNTFNEQITSYDPNGNIGGLQRKGGLGTLVDNFGLYTYQAGTNKLIGVGSSVSAPTSYGSYTYDDLGHLTSKTTSGTTYLKYNSIGDVIGIYSNPSLTTPIETYVYDDNGNRVIVTNSVGTTYYIYDAGGNVISIYKGNVQTEVPLYGSNRIGTYNTAGGGNYLYELKDNVGSVRVVLNRTKVSGLSDIVDFTDYYPYGAIAQTGTSSGGAYRYGYQGNYAEQNAATGYDNFNLRMYDARIGRWISTDPYGQYSSPYEGMGNNPVINTDPKGGWAFKFLADFHAWLSGNAASDSYKINGSWGYNEKGHQGAIYFQDGGEPMFSATTALLFTFNKVFESHNAWFDNEVDHFHGKIIGREGKMGTLNISIDKKKGYSGSDVSLGNSGTGMEGKAEGATEYITIGKTTYYFGVNEDGYKFGSYIKGGSHINGEESIYKLHPGNGIVVTMYKIHDAEQALADRLHQIAPPFGSPGGLFAPSSGFSPVLSY